MIRDNSNVDFLKNFLSTLFMSGQEFHSTTMLTRGMLGLFRHMI